MLSASSLAAETCTSFSSLRVFALSSFFFSYSSLSFSWSSSVWFSFFNILNSASKVCIIFMFSDFCCLRRLPNSVLICYIKLSLFESCSSNSEFSEFNLVIFYLFIDSSDFLSFCSVVIWTISFMISSFSLLYFDKIWFWLSILSFSILTSICYFYWSWSILAWFCLWSFSINSFTWFSISMIFCLKKSSFWFFWAISWVNCTFKVYIWWSLSCICRVRSYEIEVISICFCAFSSSISPLA